MEGEEASATGFEGLPAEPSIGSHHPEDHGEGHDAPQAAAPAPAPAPAAEGAPRGGHNDRDSISIWVRNVPDTVTIARMKSWFLEVIPTLQPTDITDVYLPVHYGTKQRKGYAFVKVGTQEAADAVLAARSSALMLDGRAITVEMATQRRRTSEEMRARDGEGRGPRRGPPPSGYQGGYRDRRSPPRYSRSPPRGRDYYDRRPSPPSRYDDRDRGRDRYYDDRAPPPRHYDDRDRDRGRGYYDDRAPPRRDDRGYDRRPSPPRGGYRDDRDRRGRSRSYERRPRSRSPRDRRGNGRDDRAPPPRADAPPAPRAEEAAAAVPPAPAPESGFGY